MCNGLYQIHSTFQKIEFPTRNNWPCYCIVHVCVDIKFSDSMWYAGVEMNVCSVLFIVCVYCCWTSKYQKGRAEIMLEWKRICVVFHQAVWARHNFLHIPNQNAINRFELAIILCTFRTRIPSTVWARHNFVHIPNQNYINRKILEIKWKTKNTPLSEQFENPRKTKS